VFIGIKYAVSKCGTLNQRDQDASLDAHQPPSLQADLREPEPLSAPKNEKGSDSRSTRYMNSCGKRRQTTERKRYHHSLTKRERDMLEDEHNLRKAMLRWIHQ